VIKIRIVREEVLGCMLKSILSMKARKLVISELDIEFIGEEGVD
jgi:hypothetical protein